MTARNVQSSRHQALLDLLTPIVAEQGYDLEELAVTAAGRRSLIRVIVDSDTGVDLDAVAAISRAISDQLESDAASGVAFAGPYVLEVSSPGVDRALTAPRHWRRSVGRLVRTSIDGAPIVGRVISFAEDVVVFDSGPAGGSQRIEAKLSTLAPGRIEVEFSRSGIADLDQDDPWIDGVNGDDITSEDK